LVPLDLRLGIIERRYTPALARVLARATALMTSQEAEGLLREVGLAMVSRSTLHRVPQAVAARYETRRELLEQALREGDSVPDSATVVQVSLDGVMVPQEGEREKPRGRKVEVNQPARHEQRYGVLDTDAPANHNGAESRSWHEAMVGTVAFWDREGQHLKTVYVARMPESGHETVAQVLEAELHAALGERPDLDVSFASDGDALQWAQLEAMAEGLSNQDLRRTTFHLDFYHAASYVHAAAAAAIEDASSALVQAQYWLAMLKEQEGGAERMLTQSVARPW
jgi:hypothetical protein